jgi:head-tail adaptor
MRAGHLDRIIELQRIALAGPNSYGSIAPTWTAFATMRAQVLANAIDDREGARGNATDSIVTFRIRWLDGLSLENRVIYKDSQYIIRQFKEVGRRVGLDIVCERVGP